MELEKYNRIKKYLSSEGFSEAEAYRMLRAADNPEEFDNNRLAAEVYNGCKEIILRACHKRCPEKTGYNNKCDSCIIQHVFELLKDKFRWKCTDGLKTVKDDERAFAALKWLVMEEHKAEHWCY